MTKRNKIFQAIDVLRGKLETRAVYTTPTNSLGLPYGSYSSPVAVHNATQLSAVYRCTDVISEALASQNWEYLKYTRAKGWSNDEFSDILFLLNNEPNNLYSKFVMIKQLISRVLLWGNGYLLITRDNIGEPIKLELVTVEVKRFITEQNTSYYQIGPDHQAQFVDETDIIHIMGPSQNGLIGESVIHHAATSLGLARATEASAQGFFNAGANMAGILQVEGKLTKEKADAIKNSWAEAFDITNGTPGGIAVMEGGLNFEPVNINPQDAQMLETRKFNVVEICRFFGVPPAKVFDDSNLTYSNIESFNLSFISDTIGPWNNKIESEFNKKLLRPSQRRTGKLNLSIEDLLRANLDAKANYVSKMFQVGGLTPDEIRQKYTHTPKTDGGDRTFIQVNMQPLDKPIVNNNNNNDGKGNKNITD